MKIVLDTNVFISGVFFNGPPYQILKAWREGRIRMLISDQIFVEYQRVGELLSNDYPNVDLGPFLELMAINTEFVIPKKLQNPVCEDPDDDKFIACAIAGKSKIIISGDKHLLKVSGYKGIKVLKPRKFVDENLDKI
jgi:putative PIN family toxin of toxin-antitoxin system